MVRYQRQRPAAWRAAVRGGREQGWRRVCDERGGGSRGEACAERLVGSLAGGGSGAVCGEACGEARGGRLGSRVRRGLWGGSRGEARTS